MLQLAADRRKKVAEILQDKQRANLSDLTLAHDVGLLYYWWAKDLEGKGFLETANEAWRQVIASWAMVLECDTFWQNWCSHQSEIYQSEISQDDVQIVRDRLEEELLKELSYHSGLYVGDRISQGDPLDIVFELETRSLQTLRLVGGFSANDENEKIVCGPLMLQRVGLSSTFSQFIADLGPIDSELPDDMFARMLQLLAGEDAGKLSGDAKIRKKLMRYFSQLGIPAACLDRSQPQRALTSLWARCSHRTELSDDSGSTNEKSPWLCRKNCPQFNECNPAYAAIDDGEQALFRHGVELAIEAHMRLAELSIAGEQVNVQQALIEWREASVLAEEIDAAEETRSAVIEMIIGRAITLEKRGKPDRAVELLEATTGKYQDDRLQGKLAELLTDCGVKAGNEEQWETAVQNLRRAYQLNPHVPRTRDNFIIALRGLAAHHDSKGEQGQASEPLKEAIRTLEVEIARDRADPRLREQLFQVQAELATVSEAEGGLLGVLSSMLAGALEEARINPSNPRLARKMASSEQVEPAQTLGDLIEALSETVDEDEERQPRPVSQPSQDRSRQVRQARNRGCLIPMAVGLVILVLSLAADRIGIGTGSGFGWRQICGLLGGLCLFLVGWALYAASGLAPNSTSGVVMRLLAETGLKYRTVLPGMFALPFSGKTRDTIEAQLRVVNDMAVVMAPLPRILGEANVLYNLLRATHTADIYKLCRDSDGDLFVSAEVPVGLLNARTLEKLVRNVIELVDLEPLALNDLERVMMRVRQLQMNAVFDTLLRSRHDEGDRVRLLIPSLARSLGIQCKQLEETRFLLTFGKLDLRVVAYCNANRISFVASMRDMRPRRGNLRYYRRMAEINMKMDVCKVALDSDDNVAFMYELPELSKETFRQMVQRMDEYVTRFGMELTVLSR